MNSHRAAIIQNVTHREKSVYGLLNHPFQTYLVHP